AHNGQLRGIKQRPLTRCKPIGTTDSEYAFCCLLDQLQQEFPEPPTPARLRRAIAAWAAELDTMGVANFLLSDSRHLYAHCSTRLVWLTRRAPFRAAHLIDADMAVDFATETTPRDIVTVVATQPLTDNEQWTHMTKGELRVFDQGL